MLLLAESAVKPNQQLHASYNTAEAPTVQLVCRTAGPERVPQRRRGWANRTWARAGRYRHASIAILMAVIIIKVQFDEENLTSVCIGCDTVHQSRIQNSIL